MINLYINKEDLTGQKFNHWKVLRKLPSKNGMSYYECECDCELHTIKAVRGVALKNGKSKSCGKGKHRINFYSKNFNNYRIINNYVEFYDKNFTCYIDLDDLNKINDCHWFCKKDRNGDIRWESTKHGLLHRFLMNYPQCKIDHIDGNSNNNRKQNLRESTTSQNAWNAKNNKRNTSGCKGVDKNNNAYINYKGKRIKLGKYKTFEEAAYARYYAEIVLYKNYSIYYSRKKEIPKSPENYLQIKNKVIEKIKKSILLEDYNNGLYQDEDSWFIKEGFC